MITIAGNSIIAFATWLVSSLLYFVGYFFGQLVIMAGYVLNWTLALNSNILDNPAVQIGWKITRDLSNLGFVFIIIFIAFGTILGNEKFQIRKMLPKLIAAALLINFSLLIAAVVLDFAGVLMNFFFNSAYTSSGGNGGIALALTGALQIHGFLKTPDISSTAFSSFSAASLNYISGLIFLDIATIVGAITLLAVGFMFLARYIIIGFLLIMLPAAIVAWVLGAKSWEKWTGKFFKYTFFGPVAGIYIYIALKTSQSIATLSGTELAKVVGEDPSGIIANVAGYLGSLIIMVAMLLYGLDEAEEMCEGFGKQTISMARGITKSWGAFGLGGLKTLTRGRFDYEKLSKQASEYGKTDKRGWVRAITRPLRQFGETGKEYSKTYGSGLNLPGNVFEEISTGLGSTSRQFRIKEQKEYGTYSGKVTNLSERLAISQGWDKTKRGDASNDAILASARKTVETNIASQKGDEKETALDKSQKYFDREMDIGTVMKQLGISRETIEKAIKENLGNITEAKKALQKEYGERREAEITNKQIDVLNKQLTSLQASLKTPPSGKRPSDIQKEIEKINEKLSKLKGNP